MISTSPGLLYYNVISVRDTIPITLATKCNRDSGQSSSIAEKKKNEKSPLRKIDILRSFWDIVCSSSNKKKIRLFIHAVCFDLRFGLWIINSFFRFLYVYDSCISKLLRWITKFIRVYIRNLNIFQFLSFFFSEILGSHETKLN